MLHMLTPSRAQAFADKFQARAPEGAVRDALSAIEAGLEDIMAGRFPASPATGEAGSCSATQTQPLN